MGNKKKWLSLLLVYGLIIGGLLVSVVWGSRAVTVISEGLPIEGRRCIIIDAGHGGEDGGAISCTGKRESDYNLEIAQRLNDLFHFLGYKTSMIRTEDISIYTKGETIAQKKLSDLRERVRIVNETENPILISIHQNHFSDSQYSGAQVFYANTQASDVFAEHLQEALVSHLNPGSRRESKKCHGIYLMEQISCPGILVECGFLSNPQEEARLRDAAYQKKLCCVIAATLASQIHSNT